MTSSWADNVLAFGVSTRRDGTRLVVEARGELDLATAPRLERVLAEALAAQHAEEVTVDLSRLDFLDLAGVRALCRCAQLARDHGAEFALASVPRQARLVLELWRGADS